MMEIKQEQEQVCEEDEDDEIWELKGKVLFLGFGNWIWMKKRLGRGTIIYRRVEGKERKIVFYLF